MGSSHVVTEYESKMVVARHCLAFYCVFLNILGLHSLQAHQGCWLGNSPFLSVPDAKGTRNTPRKGNLRNKMKTRDVFLLGLQVGEKATAFGLSKDRTPMLSFPRPLACLARCEVTALHFAPVILLLFIIILMFQNTRSIATKREGRQRKPKGLQGQCLSEEHQLWDKQKRENICSV